VKNEEEERKREEEEGRSATGNCRPKLKFCQLLLHQGDGPPWCGQRPAVVAAQKSHLEFCFLSFWLTLPPYSSQ